jgi:hypothetical protein
MGESGREGLAIENIDKLPLGSHPPFAGEEPSLPKFLRVKLMENHLTLGMFQNALDACLIGKRFPVIKPNPNVKNHFHLQPHYITEG